MARRWEILTGIDRETEQGVVQIILRGEPGRPDYMRLTTDEANALSMELMRAAAYAKAAGGVAAPAADVETDDASAPDGLALD